MSMPIREIRLRSIITATSRIYEFVSYALTLTLSQRERELF